MGLNDTASGERLHIGFFGMRNAGKSSLVNAVTNQELAVVSDVKGTTTDPVQKAMELLPLGPVVIIDTPGMDDEGTLGEMRVKKARQILAKTDVAILVVDAQRGLSGEDEELLEIFKEKKLPYIICYNKADLISNIPAAEKGAIYVSAKEKQGINELKEMIGTIAKGKENQKRVVADLLDPGDLVVLVIPIDESAPKGRIILPQQMTLRDVLDANCAAVCCQDTELKKTLESLSVKPKLIITDSQVFETVAKDTPEDLVLTSFSILMARYKGDLPELVRGAAQLGRLCDGDKVLISEGCTHHRQCNDIGTVKMPGWIEKYCGHKPVFEFTSGTEFPTDLSEYKLVVHCGGCMLNEKEMHHRINVAVSNGTPVVNYGIAIAQMHGILRRSLEPFPEILEELN